MLQIIRSIDQASMGSLCLALFWLGLDTLISPVLLFLLFVSILGSTTFTRRITHLVYCGLDASFVSFAETVTKFSSMNRKSMPPSNSALATTSAYSSLVGWVDLPRFEASTTRKIISLNFSLLASLFRILTCASLSILVPILSGTFPTIWVRVLLGIP